MMAFQPRWLLLLGLAVSAMAQPQKTAGSDIRVPLGLLPLQWPKDNAEVVDFYDKGRIKNKNLDEKIKPLHLTDQDKKDLVEFLKALSGEGWQSMGPPDKFHQ